MPADVWTDRARDWSRARWVVLGVVAAAGAVALRFLDAGRDGPRLGVALGQLVLVLVAVVLLGRRVFAHGFATTERAAAGGGPGRPAVVASPRSFRVRALASTVGFVLLDVALLVGAAVRHSRPLLGLALVVAPLALMGLGSLVAVAQTRRSRRPRRPGRTG